MVLFFNPTLITSLPSRVIIWVDKVHTGLDFCHPSLKNAECFSSFLTIWLCVFVVIDGSTFAIRLRHSYSPLRRTMLWMSQIAKFLTSVPTCINYDALLLCLVNDSQGCFGCQAFLNCLILISVCCHWYLSSGFELIWRFCWHVFKLIRCCAVRYILVI